MRPLTDVKADGSLRNPKAIAAKLAKVAVARAKRTNGRPPYDKRSSRARRIDDLMAAFLAGVPTVDEAALSLARAAAVASSRLERIEEAEVKGLEVDDALFVRVSGSLARSLRALHALKPQAPPASSAPEALANLRAHLERLAR
jgi:hypothetical protein